MTKKLLQKVIDELLKDEPDLSYIRGIVETMYESIEDERPYTPSANEIATKISTDKIIAENKNLGTDEASILDAKARVAIEKMKAFNALQKQNEAK